MSYIKQNIHGRSVWSLDVVGSADDITSLTDLMDGEIEIYDVKSSGGTKLATTPATFNRKKFSCGDRESSLSCSFTIPHVKAGATKQDLGALVVGVFDAHYDVATKATYMNLLYDRN